LVLSNINSNFQTNLLTLFEDLGWIKYVTNNVSTNAFVALIPLKLFLISVIFKGSSYLYPTIENFLPHLTISSKKLLLLQHRWGSFHYISTKWVNP